MADKKTFVRVWTAFDPVEVKKHLLLIDDLYGSCANCKQLGLNYLKDKECQQKMLSKIFLKTDGSYSSLSIKK